MRRRAWAGWVLLALAIAAGAAGTLLKQRQPWDLLAGAGLLAALVLGTSLLPFWRQALPRLEPMPGLFQAPRQRDRWCGRCGHPTLRAGPCRTCGHTPPSHGR